MITGMASATPTKPAIFRRATNAPAGLVKNRV